MPTFEPLEGPEFPITFTRTETGDEATRSGRVDSADPEEVLQAFGLPPIGESFSAARPRLKVRGYQIERLGGNWSKVTIEYSANPREILQPPVVPGRPVTLEDFGTSQTTRYFPVDAQSDFKPALNQGRGVAIDVGTLDLLIRVAYTAEQLFDAPLEAMERFNARRFVNRDEVSVPNYMDQGLPRIFEPGRLRYRGLRREPVGDFVVCEHRVGVADTWVYTDETVNASGGKSGERQSNVYPEHNFEGLWPAV